MFRTKRLFLKLLRGLEQWNSTDLMNKFTVQFDKNKGFGFLNTDVNDITVSSTLIYKSIVHQKVFDPVQNTLSTQVQVVFESVPFQINLKTGLLEAEAGGKRLGKLLSVLGGVFNFNVIIDDLHININSFLEALDRNKLIYNIKNITVTNFSPEIGLSGRFVASVQEQATARKLIKIYDLDVKNISIELSSDDSIILWRLSSSGNVAIRAEEEKLDNSIALLERSLLRFKDA